MNSIKPFNVAIIGLGAIGQTVADYVINEDNKVALSAILCRDQEKHKKLHALKGEKFTSLITNDIDEVLAAKPDLIVEAAGQESLAQYGPKILESGISILVSSIGLFTDDKIFYEFVSIAERHGAKILLSSGALPAIDWMSAAALSEVNSIAITQSKPVNSWIGTPAEQFVELSKITEVTPFFTGTAREAANLFPKSSNITAMLALATVGLDHLNVELVADPHSSEMQTNIEFNSDVGSLKTSWLGVPSNLTPSTSADVPFAIIRAIKNLSSTVVYGL
ncbi:aspartate dehydrogenase [Marinomonas sp. C2222]|uniref:L-aspartate dehydrogenase n=1 Tax=Marinomonas sargassi TaxID=2984494 RepID=A0ABT2YRP8_9GAMM|nr:aspartate dehydrogenase [Marinomonas sargassi]MCV2402550.1 aspartate dehydrogenase [Marinomonas sargassi]